MSAVYERKGARFALLSAAVVGIFLLLYLLLIIERYAVLLGFIALVFGGTAGILRSRRVKAFIAAAANEHKRSLVVLLCILLLIFPLFFSKNPYLLHLLVLTVINLIAVMGLNIQVGSAGLPNLGFAAFFGIGAYISSILAVDFGVSFWIGLLCAGVGTAAFGLLLGLPGIKTRPVYLALVTLAFGELAFNLFLNLKFLHGPDGIRNIPSPRILGWSVFESIELFGIRFPSQLNFYYLYLLIFAVLLLAARNLYHSHIGLQLNSVRENEIAARAIGINTTHIKLLAFSAGALFGGVAGSLFAHYIGYVSAQNFTITFSFALLTMVLLGGSDNILGVLVAGILLTILPEKFRALADFKIIAYGLIIVVMLIFRPQGIIPQTIRKYNYTLSADKDGSSDA